MRLGQADWKAQNGEIVGTPKPGGSGGWLVLDRSYQDVGFYASFRCTGGCKTGVLLRAEKTPQGMKGIYFALAGEEVAGYRVTLDAEGKELQREPLRRGGGQMRIAPPVDPNAPARGAGGRGGGAARGAAPAVNLPIPRPSGDLRPNEWNTVELLLDANIIRAFLNEGGELGAVAEDDAGKFGPLALYVGGTGEVRFKDVAYKDLGLHEIAAEQVSNNFRMQKIDDFYYSWGAAAGDFNHDGVLDVVAGPYYYLGPDYSKRREIFLGYVSNPGTEYSFDTWMQFAADFTGDGWDDVITASFSPSNRVPETGRRRRVAVRQPEGRTAALGQTPGRSHVPERNRGAEGRRRRRQAGTRVRRRRSASLCQAGSGKPDRALDRDVPFQSPDTRSPTASASATSTATSAWTSSTHTAGGNNRRWAIDDGRSTMGLSS